MYFEILSAFLLKSIIKPRITVVLTKLTSDYFSVINELNNEAHECMLFR